MKKLVTIIVKLSILCPIIFLYYLAHYPVLVYISETHTRISRLNFFLFALFTFLIWLVVAPGRRIFQCGGIAEVSFIFLPIEWMLLLIFAQYHLHIAILLLIVGIGLSFLCCHMLNQCNSELTKNKKNKEKIKVAKMRFCVSAMAIVLSPAAIMAVCRYHLQQPVYEAETYLTQEIQSETEEQEQNIIEQILQDNPELCSRLEETVWQTLSIEDKLETLQMITDIETSNLCIPSLNIQSTGLDLFVLGQYSAKTRQLQIDIEHLNTSTVTECIGTISHEVYHSYQHYVVDSIDWDSRTSECQFYDEARLWKDNFSNYYDSLGGSMDAYYDQPVEVSSREYSEQEVKVYLNFLEDIHSQ